MHEAKLHMKRTRDIPNPHYYIRALEGEYSSWAFNEERAMAWRGQWREQVFGIPPDHPLDLEIGIGNGYFFAHQAGRNPNRALLGVELKFKPLIQSIRRALQSGCENARVARFHAKFIDQMIGEMEVDNIFIHHPDPWVKKRQHKNRLIQREFLERLHACQKPDGFVEFKTDSRDYFEAALEEIKESPYSLEAVTFDLHNSNYASQNFVTHFESLFLKQGLPIHYALLRKPQ